MKKILVTGASSYVGAKVYKDLKSNKDLDVYGTYFSNKLFPELLKCDLTKKGEVDSIFSEIKPDIVVHIAAYASGGWCAEHENEAKDLNVNSVSYLAENCKKENTKLIFISSFAAYSANDVYGKSKKDAEEIVETLKNYVILRPSLIIGLSPNTKNDRTFNNMLNDLFKNEELFYDDSWRFHVTYLKHLSQVIEQIILLESINQITLPVVAVGETTRYDLANVLLVPFGKKVNSINKNAAVEIPKIDFKIYGKLNLPEVTHDQVIDEVKKEIVTYLDSKS